MLRYSKSKAQFFIISAAVIISILSFLSIYLQSFHLPRPSYFTSYPEFHLIGNIKDTLCNIQKNRDVYSNGDIRNFIEEEKYEIKKQLEAHGIIFEMDYEIKDNGIWYQFNLTSPGFFSQTEFLCK